MVARVSLLALCAVLVHGQGVVEGRIVDRTTSQGIPGVALKLSQQKFTYDATTDADGAFRIEAVAEGTYTARVAAADYDAEMSGTQRRPIVRVAKDEVARLTVELNPWASVSGRVIDSLGEPSSGAKVYLHDSADEIQGETSSAADGSFRFTNLHAGSYTISVKPSGRGKESQDGLEVVETYFPNVVEDDQAVRIALRAGAKADGYNVRLQRVRVFSVRGVVRDSNNRPAPNVKVVIGKRRLAGAMPGSLGEIRFFMPGAESLNTDASDGEALTTASDGTFTLPGVREGDWILQAESDWVRSESGKDVQQVAYGSALVSGRDVTDVELRLSGTFGLNVKVEVADDDKSAGAAALSLLLRPAGQGRYSFGMQAENRGLITFTDVVPGRYVFIPGAVGSFSGLHLTAILMGDVDITGVPVDLTESSPPIRAIFTRGVGSIEGTVMNAAPAVVVALPGAGASDPTITAIDVLGRFKMPGLAPGSYSVAAFDRMEGARLFEPGVLSQLTTLGTTVKVEQGGTASVELRVNPWPGQ